MGLKEAKWCQFSIFHNFMKIAKITQGAFDAEGWQNQVFGKFYENVYIRPFLHAEFRSAIEIQEKKNVFWEKHQNAKQKSFIVVISFFIFL